MSATPITAKALAALHALHFTPSWSEDDFALHIERETDRICTQFDDQTLIGFSVCRVVAGQAEILTILIHPDYQGQGLGAELLREADEDCKSRGADIIFLDVAVDNPAAISLYKKSGYTAYAKRPGYYRRADGRVGAILFQKKLI